MNGVAKEMLRTECSLREGSLATDGWGWTAGSYVLKVCAARNTKMLRCKEQSTWIDVYSYQSRLYRCLHCGKNCWTPFLLTPTPKLWHCPNQLSKIHTCFCHFLLRLSTLPYWNYRIKSKCFIKVYRALHDLSHIYFYSLLSLLLLPRSHALCSSHVKLQTSEVL